MPLIENLPQDKASSIAPGWAYVPDTGYDPSKAPIVPTGVRKRARVSQAGPSRNFESSVRQQNKVAKRLGELEKENHRDVQIVVPNRPKDVGSRGIRGKMTVGVRRIIQSQKTFANHLADEEALRSQTQVHQDPAIPTTQTVSQTASKDINKPAAGRPSRSSLSRPAKLDTSFAEFEAPTPSEPAMTTPLPVDNHESPSLNAKETDDQFWKRDTLHLPPPTEIEQLLSFPALSYSAVRAAPSSSTAPSRTFCEICGYWGNAICMKCGARICSLACRTQHDETRCLKFYA